MRQEHKTDAHSASGGASNTLDPSRWVDVHGQVLYRYALARVRRPDVAEELVQETFLSGLKSRDRFQGRSTERTWLTGILRHKILDHFRARSRGLPEVDPGNHEDALSALFDARGNWITPPDRFTIRLESLVEREEFWAVFEGCLDRLAERARHAFVLRVLEDEEVEAICNILHVSATNLYVILFRARTQMRHCLTLRWFQDPEIQPGRNDAEQNQ